MPVIKLKGNKEKMVHPLEHTTVPKVDPITFEIIFNRLQSICAEMGATVHSAAHNPLFAETKDFSCALFDHEAHMVSLGEYLPGHQGGMQNTLEGIINTIGFEGFHEGDIIMCNDALFGASHVPDLNLFHPIFYKGGLMGICGILVHHVDMGGAAPGSYVVNATEIYQEGIRYPPTTKLYEAGKLREDVLNIWLTNVRYPEIQRGDLMAQVSGCLTGAKRIIELTEKYGPKVVKDTYIAIQHNSEKVMRETIRAMPQRVYKAEDIINGDGQEDKDFKVKCTMTVDGDRLIFDFAGTDKQAKGMINCHWGVCVANCYSPSMTFAPPYLLRNYGATVPIEVITEPGTLNNASRTSAIGGSTIEAGYATYNSVYSCLSQAVPGMATGQWAGTIGLLLTWGKFPNTDTYFAFFNAASMAAGGGARANQDGWPVGSLKVANMTIPNVEIEETIAPYLRYRFRRLRPPSRGDHGQGKFCGGPGIEFELEPLGLDVNITYLTNKYRQPPEGVYGGRPAQMARLKIKDAATGRVKKVLPPKTGHPLLNGETLYCAVPGGGGYGNPKERDPQKVLLDYLDGFITLRETKEVFGVVINASKRQVDTSATKRLRAR